MRAGSRVESFARTVPLDQVSSVRRATARLTSIRKASLEAAFGAESEAARSRAAEIKDYVLANLRELLEQLEQRCAARGIQVHWCRDAESARQTVVGILAEKLPRGSVIAKAKSMATEEIHLNSALESAGFVPVETDLGEFILQADGDTPSHIVAPIIHKDRRGVARSFEREGLGPYTEEPNELAMQAREHLRGRFRAAGAGISGVNFAIAETGRLVLVENEGNNRLSTTAPDLHIAVMGIEKVLPREADLPLFLKLLSASATGQLATVYTHLISGPRRDDESDGPREVHLILLDNGRTRALAGPYRRILRCIRCGACQNACPVFRQGTGHAYGHVYSGPIGAVLAPALEGVQAFGDLPKASSLCGSCEEVCPVKIPIPEMLLRLRAESRERGVAGDGIPWPRYADAAVRPWLWRAGLATLSVAGALPFGPVSAWTRHREAPQRGGREFRRWWRERT